ncbi:MAG: DUF3048 domain-containing protein [Actinobacteria bacterium]|nr:DUF3048 domain-containing protein [Actinomycetota bacterium]
MTSRTKKGIAIGAGVLLLAGGAFFVLSNKDLPVVGKVFAQPKCPLNGAEPRNEDVLDRPAVGVKIENNPSAYPLSGLDEAEIVYEEQVEGGLTRFLAIYHCSDSTQAGPVRSSREVDPPILLPYTHILAAAGGNPGVRANLEEFNVVLIDENGAGEAMQRIPRTGISMEHTLYGDTKKLRKIGQKKFEEPPSDDIFEFGDAPEGGKRTRRIDITFGSSVISFDWKDGAWFRSDDDSPLMMENGDQLSFDNVIIEEHIVNLSTEFADIIGAPSPVIADVTGEGDAYLFRDGRMYTGVWIRESEEDSVRFETKSGEAFVLKPGNTMIELLPNDEGDVKGSFERGR